MHAQMPKPGQLHGPSDHLALTAILSENRNNLISKALQGC